MAVPGQLGAGKAGRKGAATGEGKTKKTLQDLKRFGAENGARTRDLNLGKVTLYQLSYFRKSGLQI